MQTELRDKAKELRKTVLEMCIKAKTGHVTSCFSCVEIMVALFYDVMKPEDTFILSKGQASPLLYAILADKGLIDKEELWKFAQEGGTLGVHLDHHINGAVITAGSLGHGLGIASGIALAKKMDKQAGIVYCLLGDGECWEGSIWESAYFSKQNGLNNLVVIVDCNKWSVMGHPPTDAELWSMFRNTGWSSHIVMGHDLESLHQVFYSDWNAPDISRKPRAIMARTVKGQGIGFMVDEPLWHGCAPTSESDIERARKCLK